MVSNHNAFAAEASKTFNKREEIVKNKVRSGEESRIRISSK